MILKGVTPGFIHFVFSTRSKESIMELFGLDEAGFEHYREMHEKGMENHRLSLFSFLLIDSETHRPLGECGFHTWNRTHRRAELFYMMRSESDRKKGLMTEALPYVLDYGFGTLGLHRVEALVAASNVPSVKLLLRFGFTKEGTMREDYVVNGKNEDSDCYSLLRWEWEKRSPLL